MNLRIWTTSAEPSITLVPVLYLNGTLLFVAGLSIVRVHNRWIGGWPVLLTLMGWLAMLGGLIRMIAPVSAQQAAHNSSA
jgi:predicted phage tail protein